MGRSKIHNYMLWSKMCFITMNRMSLDETKPLLDGDNPGAPQDDPLWASLVAQSLRICLSMQGTRVRALVREDPTCHGATKPVCHNYWACTLEPASHNYWARVLQLLKPARLESVLHNKRSHHNEKPAHGNKE